MKLQLATVLCAALLAAGCVSQQTYNTEVAKANTLTTQNQQLDALNQQLRGELASDQAQITQLQNQLKVTMVNEVLFAEGGWTLSPKGEAALAKIAPSLSKLQGQQIVVEGFTVVGMPRTGIRSALTDHVSIRYNTCMDNYKWGILTGFAEHVVIEHNTCSGSEDEHGIYFSNSADDPIALARLRQLAAHEVGHALGFAHNFAASRHGNGSVMDYPHPQEELRPDGTIDISKAYPQRIGDWDKVTINYGYRQFPQGTNEAPALTKILDDAWAVDLRFLTNQDMDANPRADWWSNGANQADELNRLMKVRRAALDRIGERTIRAGMPMAMIEEPLVPIYMYHHWAAEAAASIVAEFVYGPIDTLLFGSIPLKMRGLDRALVAIALAGGGLVWLTPRLRG